MLGQQQRGDQVAADHEEDVDPEEAARQPPRPEVVDHHRAPRRALAGRPPRACTAAAAGPAGSSGSTRSRVFQPASVSRPQTALHRRQPYSYQRRAEPPTEGGGPRPRSVIRDGLSSFRDHHRRTSRVDDRRPARPSGRGPARAPGRRARARGRRLRGDEALRPPPPHSARAPGPPGPVGGDGGARDRPPSPGARAGGVREPRDRPRLRRAADRHARGPPRSGARRRCRPARRVFASCPSRTA